MHIYRYNTVACFSLGCILCTGTDTQGSHTVPSPRLQEPTSAMSLHLSKYLFKWLKFSCYRPEVFVHSSSCGLHLDLPRTRVCVCVCATRARVRVHMCTHRIKWTNDRLWACTAFLTVFHCVRILELTFIARVLGLCESPLFSSLINKNRNWKTGIWFPVCSVSAHHLFFVL